MFWIKKDIIPDFSIEKSARRDSPTVRRTEAGFCSPFKHDKKPRGVIPNFGALAPKFGTILRSIKYSAARLRSILLREELLAQATPCVDALSHPHEQARAARFSCAVIILAAFIMPLFLFLGAGCGKEDKKVNKVVIWHWMTDRQDAFSKLAEQYKTKTGIIVDFQLYAPSDIYASKVKAAAYTKTLPDIYGILGETIVDFSNFVKSGLVENLTPYMEENKGQWKSCFFEKALSVNEFKPDNEFGVAAGIYGVPIDTTNIQMLYNKKLFKKAGLDPEKAPTTWNEFLADIKKLKDAGIPGLVGGFGETWMLDCLASNYAWNIMGKDKILKTIRGNVKYTDPDWLKVFGLFEEMYKNNVIARGSITMINKDAEQSFANERAAFAFNGSWCVNVYSGMNPGLQYAVMLPPKVSDSYPMKIWGGAGSSFVINSGSKIKPDVIAFLKWLTESEQQAFLAIATKNLPANKNSLKEIPPILLQFADQMDKTMHPRELPVNEFPAVIEAFDKGLQSILIGEKTAQEMARNVQEIKDREMKRLQRSPQRPQTN